MASMSDTWFSLDDAVLRVGLKRLASMVNEKSEAIVIGTGAGGQTLFTTPYVRSTTIVPYLDGVAQTTGSTISFGTGLEGEDEITFALAPDGKQVAASTPNGILLDLLVTHILESEALVMAAMASKGYGALAFDEVPVPPYDLVLPKSWAWKITEAALVKALKRAPLDKAFDGIREAYFEVVGGPDFKKNPGLLSMIDLPFMLNWHRIGGIGGISGSGADSGATIIANRRVFRESAYNRDFGRNSLWD